MRQPAARHATTPEPAAGTIDAGRDRTAVRAAPHTGETADEIAALVADAASGDESAWESLVRLYGRRIYALAKSRLHDPDAAEEITQSVFATLATTLRTPDSSPNPEHDPTESSPDSNPESAATNRATYTEAGKFEPWLFRIVMNRVRDEGRRRQRRAGTITGLGPAEQDQIAGCIGNRLGGRGDNGSETQTKPAAQDARDELAAMHEAIQTLEPRDREIIELRHHGSLSFAQIADLLDEPLGTCLARHHRALKKLRDRIVAAQQTTPPPDAHSTRQAGPKGQHDPGGITS